MALPSRVARYEAWLSPLLVKRRTVGVGGRNRRRAGKVGFGSKSRLDAFGS
jgi:hypothetical protein